MKILVCIDGESHTRGAIGRAISLGLSRPAEVTALHVIDPWLKQFHNEIYAQGRQRYLEYVDACLLEQAEQARWEFDGFCRAEGLRAGIRIRHGEPLAEILKEVRRERPDLLITGRKPLTGWARFRSGNLPRKLGKRIGCETRLVSVEA